MSSRRVLAAVARAVSDSFMSRNNDLGGYWAIGQLLSYVLAKRNVSLTIDLISGTSEPPLTELLLSTLPARSSELFWSNVHRQGLARSVVHRASLAFECDLTQSRARGDRTEYPVQCRVAIEDDRGRSYAALSEAWCFPHDPAHELKSVRGA
jgi:hypothetical protein